MRKVRSQRTSLNHLDGDLIDDDRENAVQLVL